MMSLPKDKTWKDALNEWSADEMAYEVQEAILRAYGHIG